MVLSRRANIGLVNIRSNEYLWKICGQQYLWKICAHQAYLINITLTNCWILIEGSVKPTDKDVLVTGELFFFCSGSTDNIFQGLSYLNYQRANYYV